MNIGIIVYINNKFIYLIVFMKKLSILFALYIFLSNFSISEARSWCCSHHWWVCGCWCCDGSSLSETCAPYYPQCSSPEPDYSNNSNVPEPSSTTIVPDNNTTESYSNYNIKPEPLSSPEPSTESSSTQPSKNYVNPSALSSETVKKNIPEQNYPAQSLSNSNSQVALNSLNSTTTNTNSSNSSNKDDSSSLWWVVAVILGLWIYYSKKKK